MNLTNKNKILRLVIPSLIFFLGLGAEVFAQESIMAAYQRNFIRANLTTKGNILKDAATDDRASEFIGPLYEYALNYAIQYADILKDDPDMLNMAVIATQGLGRVNYRASIDSIWRLFLLYRDSLIRVEALRTLGGLGKGIPQVADNLNQYLSSQNSIFRSGITPDYPALTACIMSLAELGDDSSFQVLFSTMLAGYPDNIYGEASKALDALPGDYKGFLLSVIRDSPPAEKLAALNVARGSSRFTAAELGELAEASLNAGFEEYRSSPEYNVIAAELRYSAIRLITRLQWSRATESVIKHFYRVRGDYLDGLAEKERFLESIYCLGVMENSEAAQALALQLGLFNSQMERGGELDEVSAHGVILALGNLGDKTAFDYLLYVGYLSYPESIQAAAKDALAKLRW